MLFAKYYLNAPVVSTAPKSWRVLPRRGVVGFATAASITCELVANMKFHEVDELVQNLAVVDAASEVSYIPDDSKPEFFDS